MNETAPHILDKASSLTAHPKQTLRNSHGEGNVLQQHKGMHPQQILGNNLIASKSVP